MSTSIAMHAPKNALPKDCSLVSDVSGALRVLRNLSRFGRKAWLDRALSSSAVTQRIDLRCAGGETVTVDEAYVRESILTPAAKITAGFQPIMPTFQGLVTEEQLLELIEYVKSLKALPQVQPR